MNIAVIAINSLLLLLISVFDVRTKRIPLFLNITLLLFSILYSLLENMPRILNLLNPVIGFAFIYLIRILTKKGIGLGDAILSSSIAAILGLRYWLPVMTTASLLALIYIAGIKFIRKADISGMRIPFAPFMSAGAILFMLIEKFLN